MNFRHPHERRGALRLASAAVAVLIASLGFSASVMALDKVNFQWSWIPTGYYSPISAAIAKGFYEEEGIELTVSTGRGSGDAVKKVAGGGSPIGDGDMSAVMAARAQEGAPVQCLMHMHNHSPHSLFILKSSGIEHFRDLEGKTLATTPGNSHRNYFPIAARMAGLDPDTVSWTVVDATAMPSLLVNKRVDGVPYFTSNASFVEPQVKAIGDELVIIPFADYGFDIYSYCIYARDDVIEEQSDMLRRFVKATQRAHFWARDNPEEAARLHKERWPDTKYEDNLAGWIDLRRNMFGADLSGGWTGHYDMDKVKRTYEVLVESRGLDPEFAVEQVIHDSLLPSK